MPTISQQLEKKVRTNIGTPWPQDVAQFTHSRDPCSHAHESRGEDTSAASAIPRMVFLHVRELLGSRSYGRNDGWLRIDRLPAVVLSVRSREFSMMRGRDRSGSDILLGEPELGVVSISGIHGGRWACAMPKSVRQAGWLCLLFVSAVDELSS